MSDKDIREILDRLARIETKLEMQSPQWGEHARRLESLESGVGRQNFVASILGALAAGIVLMAKYMVGK